MPDLEADVRLPPHDRLGRPRAGRERGAAGDRAAARERRRQHRRRPHRGHPAVAGAAARGTCAARVLVRDRLRRRHARVPGLADGQVTAPALLRRHDDHRGHAGRDRESPGRRVDAGLRRRRRGPGRRVGRGHHRACSTCPPGLRECGSSSARSARTPARSCGSPTSTATGSPPSPPTRGKASSPTWNCGTAGGPAARTGSATPRTPGCGTCRCKGFAQNQIWCEIVALACELLRLDPDARALTGEARRWEPKRLRLRLFSRRRPARARRPPPAAPARRTMALG